MNHHTHTSPRDYTAAHALVGQASIGAGMPHDRHARIAARRAFVEIKQSFMRAVDTLDDGDEGIHWLRHQVRQAHEPEDLWLLRSALFRATRSDADNGPRTRHELRRSLDSMFPGTFVMSGFAGM